MSIKKSILTCLSLATLLATSAFALGEQAGYLADGKAMILSRSTGIVSYFTPGKEGNVHFYCTVVSYSPGRVEVSVAGGKNLFLNAPTTIKSETGRWFNWKLLNLGADGGNIKLSMLTKDGVAEVRCQES